MQAGRLHHRITIQAPTYATDGNGERAVASWSDVLTSVPARVNEQSSREVYRARQVIPETTHLIEMRWTAAITHDRRIKWTHGSTTRYLRIVGDVNPDGRRRELAVSCVETAGSTGAGNG